jgi:antirestriction protein ArdC
MIALLEQGAVPWHKPWNARTSMPRNLITNKPYRGINVFLLLAMSYESPFWLTFRQAVSLGGSVRKGEKACPVVFWKRLTIEDKESGEKEDVPLLRFYHVFNTAQCEGLGEAAVTAAAPTTAEIASTKPDEIVAGMPQRPVIKHDMTHPFYSPFEDVVAMPARERFDTAENYYAALFHELIHSTGHESRLNRSTLTEKAGYGSDPYCKEELIAEMGAAFLCAQAEIVDRTIDNSAAYIRGWLERLGSDRSLVVQAAAQAQKAADYILNRRSAETEVSHD